MGDAVLFAAHDLARKLMRRPVVAVVLLMLALGTLALLTGLGGGDEQTLASRRALLSPALTVERPDGEGPFPVVLLFHGCGGLVGARGPKPIIRDYARAASEAGWAAVIVDSFAPRGIDPERAIRRVCSGFELRGARRAGDVLASLDHVRRQPWAMADNIVLAGWSHGGWAVMEAMIIDAKTDAPPGLTALPGDILQGVTGVYLTYPYCGFPAGTRRTGWVHDAVGSIVLAGNDDVARHPPCEQAFGAIRAGGATLDIEIFDGVTHAFDESDQIQDSAFVFDPVATSRAHERFAGYLRSLR
jgi:dienelactone hydrolase